MENIVKHFAWRKDVGKRMRDGWRGYPETGAADRRLRAFARRAGAKKRRWFSAALRPQENGACQGRDYGPCRRMFCLLFLFLSLWALIFTGRTGGWSREDYLPAYSAEMPEEGEENAEGWETEIFGVRIRFSRGQITFFREKKQAVRESQEIH